MKKRLLGAIAALFALVLLPLRAQAADSVYAILYDDGTLVFQYGDKANSAKTAVKTYAVYTGYPSNYAPWHNERESVRVVDFADKISPKATAYWFYECKNLERVDNIQNLDTANVTTMRYMFYGCSGLTALDVSKFNTANVTDMSWMFYGCRGLTALDVSNFNTANVMYMRYMFSGCSGLTTLDVSKFDTAKVVYMYDMFRGCSGLTTLDVSKFNTANVKSMSEMFYGCSGLTTLDVSKFDTAKVEYMYDMFRGCSGLTALDVSKFDTANVTDMNYMFYGCSGLTALNLSSFDTANVKRMKEMFSGCSKLKLICASEKFVASSVPETEYQNSRNMFKGCAALVGGNGTAYDESHLDKSYARLDTLFAPGYFTASGSEPTPTPNPETYVITAYVGEGGAVTPAGDSRVRAGDSQKYEISPHSGWRVSSVLIDGVEMGPLSEYVFVNVSRDHSLKASFARLPQYEIVSAVAGSGKLSVTLKNTDAVTVAVSYFDLDGKFLSADLKGVAADAGAVTFALPFAYKARVALFDSACRPLCAAVTVG